MNHQAQTSIGGIVYLNDGGRVQGILRKKASNFGVDASYEGEGGMN